MLHDLYTMPEDIAWVLTSYEIPFDLTDLAGSVEVKGYSESSILEIRVYADTDPTIHDAPIAEWDAVIGWMRPI
jgi:hypothetical protein